MTDRKTKHPGKIVLIEGKQTNHPSFFLSLIQKGFDVEIAATGSAAIQKIEEVDPILILIDAASLRTVSNRIIYRIKQTAPTLRVILIIDDTLKDKKISKKADVVMILPFKIQSLLNQINLVLSLTDPNARRIGRLIYNPKSRAVSMNGRVTGLTPILSKILELFLEQQGQVIQRCDIFRSVWETDFTEDMRTLEVHIQWLRKALEKDPSKPKIILTERMVGYKLDPGALMDN